jgi:hypothetical protein
MLKDFAAKVYTTVFVQPKTIHLEIIVKMSEENCGESDVSVSCRYSSTVKKYVSIINSTVSNFIPEKSKRQFYMETLIWIKY